MIQLMWGVKINQVKVIKPLITILQIRNRGKIEGIIPKTLISLFCDRKSIELIEVKLRTKERRKHSRSFVTNTENGLGDKVRRTCGRLMAQRFDHLLT